MRIVRTASFERSLSKLPSAIQSAYVAQEERVQNDWRDARLHLKKLRGLDGVYSLRVTRSYRALFYFDAKGNAILFDIDDRKDIYR